MSSAPEIVRPKQSFSASRVLLVVIPLAIVCGVAFKVTANRIEQQAKQQGEEVMLNWFGLASPTDKRLDAQFSDADEDFVADVPADTKQLTSPETMTFSYIAGAESEQQRAQWEILAKHISRQISKPVVVVAFNTTEEQLSAMKKGKLHISGFNTGAVPSAVSTCGFVPICTMGHEDGSFGTAMQFIVAAGSPIHSVQDLKNHTLTFTSRGSNSGYKAALVLLREFDLLPQRDYSWQFSGGHDESIRGVASGEFEAAPVSNDLLQRAISNGDVTKDGIRIIYESERFPPATLGYAYNLTPDLASKIRSALLDFSWRGTNLEKQLEAAGTTKFVPVSYKKDFALIRRIDDAFRKSPTASVTE